MGRMHSKGKGMSSSALPYKRSPPSWLKTTVAEVRSIAGSDPLQQRRLDVARGLRGTVDDVEYGPSPTRKGQHEGRKDPERSRRSRDDSVSTAARARGERSTLPCFFRRRGWTKAPVAVPFLALHRAWCTMPESQLSKSATETIEGRVLQPRRSFLSSSSLTSSLFFFDLFSPSKKKKKKLRSPTRSASSPRRATPPPRSASRSGTSMASPRSAQSPTPRCSASSRDRASPRRSLRIFTT